MGARKALLGKLLESWGRVAGVQSQRSRGFQHAGSLHTVGGAGSVSTPLLWGPRLLGLAVWPGAAARGDVGWGPALGQWQAAGVKSPSLPWRPARRVLAPQNLPPDKIFHVIVAPCYDKKLEALREDFSPALHSYRGADCVLTSGEQHIV